MSELFSKIFNDLGIMFSKNVDEPNTNLSKRVDKMDLVINEWEKNHNQLKGEVKVMKSGNRGESIPKSALLFHYHRIHLTWVLLVVLHMR